MTSKVHFPSPPPYNCYTTCERNAQLLFVEAAMPREEEPEFEDINCTSEKSRFVRSRELTNAVFLENAESLKLRLIQAWSKHGFTGLLVELTSLKQKTSSPAFHLISKWATVSLSFCRWLKSPHLAMPTDVLINDFSSTRQWKESYVRCLAWHPHCDKIAIAIKDDEILVKNYLCTKDIQTLKHPNQKGIASIAWRPFSATTLAVACHSCLLIWNPSPSTASVKSALSQTAQVLVKSGHCPLSSVAWDPHGNLLLTCSPVDNAVVVWNVDLEEHQAIMKVGCGGFINAHFSPDSLKLMTTCSSPCFKLFECLSWQCETWGNLLGRCQSYCWSPDGSTLLFTTSDDPTIYSIVFLPSDIENTLKSVKPPKPVIDLNFFQETTEICVGGTVQCLSWDPHGERLAVMFKGSSANLIALFQTKWMPTFEAIPRGLIKGKADEIPVCMAFKPTFAHGSLLTIAWSSGRVSHMPLFYTPRKILQTNSEAIKTPTRRIGSIFSRDFDVSH